MYTIPLHPNENIMFVNIDYIMNQSNRAFLEWHDLRVTKGWPSNHM